MANILFGNGNGAGLKNDNLPTQVKNLRCGWESGKIFLYWSNPQMFFSGLIIIRKQGSVPLDINDGVEIYNGNGETYTDNVVNGTLYYYRFFPYNSKGQFQTSIVGGTTAGYTSASSISYCVRIDTENSDPEASVTYVENSVGLVPSLGNNGNFIDNGWETRPIYKDLRPCLFKDGLVVRYLSKNNFNNFEDGSVADTTSGNSGEVMIEIPKMAYAIYYDENERYLYVKLGMNPYAKQMDNNLCYYGHTRDVEGDRDNLYVGAYLPNVKNIGGKTAKWSLASASIGNFASTITAELAYHTIKGNGYDALSFYPLMLIRCLYLIRYKNLNSQVALGRGYVDTSTRANTAGVTATFGMNYGTDTGTNGTNDRIKCNGIEDLWGTREQYVAGYSGSLSSATSNPLRYEKVNSTVGFKNFSAINGASPATTMSTYLKLQEDRNSISLGGINLRMDNKKNVFLPQNIGFSSDSYEYYFTDIGSYPSSVSVGNHLYSGGWRNRGNAAGIFTFITNYTRQETIGTITETTSRTMYL